LEGIELSYYYTKHNTKLLDEHDVIEVV
jgi:hypothetical protein